MKIPPNIQRAAKRYGIRAEDLAEWILETMDTSLVREAAKNFKILVAEDPNR